MNKMMLGTNLINRRYERKIWIFLTTMVILKVSWKLASWESKLTIANKVLTRLLIGDGMLCIA